MKLLRLTSTEPNGNFDNILNTDLIIKPYSEIALANATFTNQYPVLQIDGSNDTISYNTGSGLRTAILTHAVYSGTSSEGLVLLQDITAKLNGKLRLLTGKEFGGQFKVGLLGGAIAQAYMISPWGFGEQTFDYAENWNISGNDNDAQRTITNGSAGAIADDSIRCVSNGVLCKGCGVWRFQLQLLTPNGTANNGMRLVLTETHQQELDALLSADQDKYSISVIPDDVAATFKYVMRAGDGNTVDVPDPATPGQPLRPVQATEGGDGFANPLNDVIQLDISNGNVNGRIYQNVGGVMTERLVFTDQYNRVDLNGVHIIRGLPANCKGYNPRFHIANGLRGLVGLGMAQHGVNKIIQHDASPDGLEATAIPTPPNNRTSTFTLDYSQATTLADFLGMVPGTTNYVYTRPNYTDMATFSSNSTFSLSLPDSYVIEFMSMQLDSYDGKGMDYKNNTTSGMGGQYSILKVIPNVNTRSNRKCNYEANTLQFINMNNSKPITLRNIKARILDARLEAITTVGLSMLTCIIKEKEE